MYLASHQSTANSSSLVKAASAGGIYTDSKLGREAAVLHSVGSVGECNNREKTTSGDKGPLFSESTNIKV